MRLQLAIRAFFASLFNADRAARIERVLTGEDQPAAVWAAPANQPEAASRAAAPGRNDAIGLLAALQREARFVDIVKEPLGEYSDEQVGAAARDVLRDCGAILDRFFALEPAVDAPEGASLETPADFDASQYRLIGEVAGDPPFAGRLVHHGWKATRCELPHWSGAPKSAMVVAPIELEIS